MAPEEIVVLCLFPLTELVSLIHLSSWVILIIYIMVVHNWIPLPVANLTHNISVRLHLRRGSLIKPSSSSSPSTELVITSSGIIRISSNLTSSSGEILYSSSVLSYICRNNFCRLWFLKPLFLSKKCRFNLCYSVWIYSICNWSYKSIIIIWKSFKNGLNMICYKDWTSMAAWESTADFIFRR